VLVVPAAPNCRVDYKRSGYDAGEHLAHDVQPRSLLNIIALIGLSVNQTFGKIGKYGR
jgi:hypothetical protein